MMNQKKRVAIIIILLLMIGSSFSMGLIIYNQQKLSDKTSNPNGDGLQTSGQEIAEEVSEEDLLRDLTENYVKEVTEEDIVFYEEERVYYVKNQIMVGAYLGTPKETMEQLAEEIGADIVGYVELIADYQLEFRRDMSYAELMQMVEYVETFPFIDYSELNLATPCEPQ